MRAWDVRGEYALSYDDQLTVALTTGGSLRQKVAGASDTVVLGSANGQTLTLDLSSFCVQTACPAGVLGSHVSIDQVDPTSETPRHVIEMNGHPGQVDHTQSDELTVSIAGAGCAPLSVITGRFSHLGETVTVEPLWQDADGGACDPLDGGTCMLLIAPGGVSWPGDAAVDGLSHGRVAALYPASCAFANLDGTLLLAAGFVGSRIGDSVPLDLSSPTID